MAGKAQSGKKGGRKIGRQKRKPAHNRYTLEKRWEQNKERRMARQKKAEEKKKARKQMQETAINK